jgi:hypothetical protein
MIDGSHITTEGLNLIPKIKAGNNKKKRKFNNI